MGKHTKMASALMTASISGGAISPVVQWATENQHSLKFSSFAALIVFTSGWIYLAYLNLVLAAPHQVQHTHEGGNQRQASRSPRRSGRSESELKSLRDCSDKEARQENSGASGTASDTIITRERPVHTASRPHSLQTLKQVSKDPRNSTPSSPCFLSLVQLGKSPPSA